MTSHAMRARWHHTRCGLARFGAAGCSDAPKAEAERGHALPFGLGELHGRAMPTATLPTATPS
ncbi:hypothetical protein NFX46_00610 [Streptomyces phaeoluteigriseus]|uniref:Uncharacterized protein n=1 Tax=Streptomyces phaeoluteigriseus TaxID=114686 RepID=A0ABY4Z0X2_9ACTN|nr:hypothetical protein [Streptomyces phaeoluteigriseus]USQ82399.1 hypothetical protein NFX46_00610 [Streptomyces phaeoluteigriseus]